MIQHRPDDLNKLLFNKWLNDISVGRDLPCLRYSSVIAIRGKKNNRDVIPLPYPPGGLDPVKFP